MTDVMVTVDEAALRLHVSVPLVEALIQSRDIESDWRGGRLLIRARSLDKFARVDAPEVAAVGRGEPLKIGYARVSTESQDPELQVAELMRLGCERSRVYQDHGLTGTNRARPGLREALAACRDGDTLVVTKLDRLARSMQDARNIADELTARGVRLQIAESVHDPANPAGRMLFSMLAMFAEFETDLVRQRTKEGMAVARAKGRLKGGLPKLSKAQERHLVSLVRAGEHTMGEIAELFGVSRPTCYRAVERAERVGVAPVTPLHAVPSSA